MADDVLGEQPEGISSAPEELTRQRNNRAGADMRTLSPGDRPELVMVARAAASTEPSLFPYSDAFLFYSLSLACRAVVPTTPIVLVQPSGSSIGRSVRSGRLRLEPMKQYSTRYVSTYSSCVVYSTVLYSMTNE